MRMLPSTEGKMDGARWGVGGHFKRTSAKRLEFIRKAAIQHDKDPELLFF